MKLLIRFVGLALVATSMYLWIAADENPFDVGSSESATWFLLGGLALILATSTLGIGLSLILGVGTAIGLIVALAMGSPWIPWAICVGGFVASMVLGSALMPNESNETTSESTPYGHVFSGLSASEIRTRGVILSQLLGEPVPEEPVVARVAGQAYGWVSGNYGKKAELIATGRRLACFALQGRGTAGSFVLGKAEVASVTLSMDVSTHFGTSSSSTLYRLDVTVQSSRGAQYVMKVHLGKSLGDQNRLLPPVLAQFRAMAQAGYPIREGSDIRNISSSGPSFGFGFGVISD